MRTLYLTEEGCHIQKNGGRYLVTKGDAILRTIGIEQLDNVILFGNIQLSARVITDFLRGGIPMTWLSGTGLFFGRLESTQHINISKQRQQFRLGDDTNFCLRLAKNILEAKAANSLTIMRRYQRAANVPAIDNLIQQVVILSRKIHSMHSLEQLLGIEGSIARQYFRALSLVVNPDFAFSGRNKRPPRDPFNSLLSFGYTLLLYDVYTAIASTGLHPYAGLLHKDRQGHPALASDLMEEWRAPIVDSLVLSMVQRREIQPDDFQPPDVNGGVYLCHEASKLFIAAYEKRLNRQNQYGDKLMTFRELLHRQAGLLCKALLDEDPDIYEPIFIR